MQVNTVELIGPAGRIVVNEADVAGYRAKGYRLPGETAVEAVSDPGADTKKIDLDYELDEQ